MLLCLAAFVVRKADQLNNKAHARSRSGRAGLAASCDPDAVTELAVFLQSADPKEIKELIGMRQKERTVHDLQSERLPQFFCPSSSETISNCKLAIELSGSSGEPFYMIGTDDTYHNPSMDYITNLRRL